MNPLPRRSASAVIAPLARAILAPTLTLSLALQAATAPGVGAQLTEPLSPCTLEGVEGPVRCGSLEVVEDPANPDGRRIDIRVAVLPSVGGEATAPPLALLAGGPGQAASAMADFAVQAFAGVRGERDILLVDARGTGRSNPLDCPEFSAPSSPSEYTGALFSPERVRRCRRTLSRTADLELYTTSRIADDNVRVWRAMGHDRVDVYGTSYGTRLALEIMRRHPESLRTVVLKGVAPMELRVPLSYPRDGQRALERIFEHCRAEAACAGAYPRLDVELQEVLAELEEGVQVHLKHPVSGDTATVRMHREPVTQAMMGMLQSTGTAVFLPRMIHAAAGGDWKPLAGFALFYRVTLAGELHEGMFLSVTCAEDIPYIDPEDAARTGEDTFLDVARYTDQAAACAVWDVPAVDAAFREPVRSSVPTLLVSGNYDPVTPPRWGWKAAERLENAFHLVVPEGSHSFAGMQGCVDAVIARFVESGTLPTEADPCIDDIDLGTFSLPDEPWPPPLVALLGLEPEGG